MFFLGKLLSFRDSGSDSLEEGMSLIEHLEDLRTMIVRIVITLFIGVVVCFTFRNTLMEVMRKPIDRVWTLQLNESLEKLPVEIKASTWERAGKAVNEGILLSSAQREHFYKNLAADDEDFLFHVETLTLYRSVISIKDKKEQEKYISGIPDIDEKMRGQLQALSERYKKTKGLGPDPDADSRRRLVFMQSLHPTEGFILSFKLALYAGIAVTFPFLLYFLLQFILPGLHKREKKVLFPSLFIGFLLFSGGVLFAYFLVLPRALEFFSSFSGGMGISNDWRIGDYISFTTQFILIFGLAFELPVLVLALVILDFLSYTTMAKSRTFAVVGILVIAAVITPTPDAMTLGLLAVPMYILYEICIICAWFIERGRKKKRLIEKAKEETELAEYRKKRLEKQIATANEEEHLERIEGDTSDDDFEQEPDDDYPQVAGTPGLQSFDVDEDESDEDDFDDSEEDIHDYFDEYDDEFEEGHYEDPHHIGEAFREQNERIQKLEESLKLKLAMLEEISNLEGAEPALDPEAEAREAGGADFEDSKSDEETEKSSDDK